MPFLHWESSGAFQWFVFTANRGWCSKPLGHFSVKTPLLNRWSWGKFSVFILLTLALSFKGMENRKAAEVGLKPGSRYLLVTLCPCSRLQSEDFKTSKKCLLIH